MSYSGQFTQVTSCKMWACDWPLGLSMMLLSFIDVFQYISTSFILYMSNILSYWHTFCLWFYQLVAFRLPPLLAYHKWCFCEHSCVFVGKVFISVRHIWGVFLDHMVLLCLPLWGTVKLFLRVAISFYIPTMKYESSDCHILA